MMMGLGDAAGVGSGGSGGVDGGGKGDSGGAASGAGAGAASGGTGSGGTPPASAGAAGTGTPSLGTSGEGQKSWREALPAELQSDPTLNKYSDLTNLAKAHVELQKKFGEKGVFKPKPGASKEEIQSFREALGIPTTPDKYDMGKFEGVEIPAPTLAWAQKLGAEHGVEPTAMKAIIQDYFKLDATNQGVQAAEKTRLMQVGIAELKKEWGDGFDRNIKRAELACEKMGGPDLIQHLVKLGVHNDPILLKALEKAAQAYGEDTMREAGAGNGQITPAELDGQIALVQKRLFSMKPTDGAYAAAKNEYESLWKQKTKGK